MLQSFTKGRLTWWNHCQTAWQQSSAIIFHIKILCYHENISCFALKTCASSGDIGPVTVHNNDNNEICTISRIFNPFTTPNRAAGSVTRVLNYNFLPNSLEMRADKRVTLENIAEEWHNESELASSSAPVSSWWTQHTSTDPRQALYNCCSSHMDLARVQHKAVVALFHKTTCFHLDPNSCTFWNAFLRWHLRQELYKHILRLNMGCELIIYIIQWITGQNNDSKRIRSFQRCN